MKRMPKTPPDEAKAKREFFKCPHGHSLPNRTGNGECTPMRCAESGTPVSAQAKNLGGKPKGPNKLMLPKSVTQTPTTPATAEAREQRLLSFAMAAAKVRQTATQVPKGLTGVEAEEWTRKKLGDLQVLAAAEAEYRLNYGDDSQRWDAARYVLDSNGHGKKETGGNGGPVIILNGVGVVSPPWRKIPIGSSEVPSNSLPASAQTVDVTAHVLEQKDT